MVARTGGSRGGVQPYEKGTQLKTVPSLEPALTLSIVALKDVVWLNTNEQVNVIARYAPWDGLYMVSCAVNPPREPY